MKRAILITALALAAFAAPPAAAQIDVDCFSPTAAPCGDVWHDDPVSIDWSVVPPFVPVAGWCVDTTIDWDTKGESRGCKATTSSSEASLTVTLRVDTKPPAVSVTAREPDSAGWYRSPVQVTFSGTDQTSGLEGCSSGSYSGPDAASAEVVGRCWDVAGNVSDPLAFGLRYDAHPPALQQIFASGRDHKVRLDWNVPDAAGVDVEREGRRLMSGGPSGSVVDRGLRNGRRYEYVVTATDAAGNTAKKTLAVVPGPRLFDPAHGAALISAPLLRWTSVRGADYYNVQLFRGRRKVLSVWPAKPRLQLHGTWRYGGHAQRLEPGKRYRWFVWPGEGPRSRSDYGRLIGSRTFVLAP